MHFARLLVVLFITAAASRAAPLTIHVALDGNDAWSGRLAAPAADRKDGPLRTVEAALRTVRAARQPGRGATILFRAGRHELAEPLALTPSDSGASAEQPFTLAAFPGEQPVLSGGRRLHGWQPVAGQSDRWQTQAPGVKEGRHLFRQLFINGQRQQRARTPNEGYFRIQSSSPQDKPVKIAFAPGNIKKSWAADGDVELIALLAWADIRMQIRDVDEAARIATLSGNPRPSNRENNARYFIENAPDALDAPGEWYLDRRSGIVTWLAPRGQNPNDAEVVVPEIEELLTLRGDFATEQPVRHVVVRGLTFSHTNWTLGPQGQADTQAAVATRGDVLAEGATDCLIEDCTFTGLAGYAIELGRGCQRFRIVRNEMRGLGAGGVRIGDTNRAPKPFEANHGHTVTDNHIHDCGLIYPPAVGVFIMLSGGNRVAHNHIHHLHYSAISLGWNWGYQETPCRENVVEFNHLHHIGQATLSDMGAVYTLGIQRGTVIRHNHIHDVDSFTYGGWGLYTDEGSTGIVLENNLVHHCKSAGFHQHYGRDNVVRNNVFAFNREHQLMRTREEGHTSFEFTGNIVLFDSGELLGSNWANNHFVMDRNVYWDTRPGAAEKLTFRGATFAQWQARGHDKTSLIADPRFVAPAAGDFSLHADSPALKLGFKPIDTVRIGIRPRDKQP